MLGANFVAPQRQSTPAQAADYKGVIGLLPSRALDCPGKPATIAAPTGQCVPTDDAGLVSEFRLPAPMGILRKDCALPAR